MPDCCSVKFTWLILAFVFDTNGCLKSNRLCVQQRAGFQVARNRKCLSNILHYAYIEDEWLYSLSVIKKE